MMASGQYRFLVSPPPAQDCARILRRSADGLTVAATDTFLALADVGMDSEDVVLGHVYLDVIGPEEDNAAFVASLAR